MWSSPDLALGPCAEALATPALQCLNSSACSEKQGIGYSVTLQSRAPKVTDVHTSFSQILLSSSSNRQGPKAQPHGEAR